MGALDVTRREPRPPRRRWPRRISLRPRLERPGAPRVGRLGQQPPHRQPHPAGVLKAPRQRHARARPAHARRVLGHVAGSGHATTGTPHASARATVPCPAWQTTAAQQRHRPRVGDPVDQRARSPARRAASRAAAPVGRWPAPAPARPASPSRAARSSSCSGSCEVVGATSTSGSSPGGSSTSPNGCSHSSGPGHPHAGGQRPGAGTRAGGTSPPAPARARSRRARARAPAARRARARRSARARPAPRRPRRSGRSAPHSRGAHARAREHARPTEYGGQPGLGRPESTWGTSVAHGRSSTCAASDAATVRMSATTASGRTRGPGRGWLARRAPPPGRAPAARGPRAEHLVLGRGREAHPLALHVLAPATHVSSAHLVAARRELARPGRSPGRRARDPRRRPGAAAGAARSFAQSISAMSRTICLRRSASSAIGEHDQRADARVAVDVEPVAHLVARARPAPPCRSARRAAPRRPRPSCRPGRGPGPSWPRPRTRSGARARCRSSSPASPCRRRTGRAGAASESRARSMSSSIADVHRRGDVEGVVQRPGPRLPRPPRAARATRPRARGRRRSASSRRRSRPVSCVFFGPMAAM